MAGQRDPSVGEVGVIRGEIKDKYEQLEHFPVSSLLSAGDRQLTSPPYKTERSKRGIVRMRFHHQSFTVSPVFIISYLPLILHLG